MNLRQAEYFLEVIRAGGITNAARNLMISQPALSQVIKNIEKDIDAPLFIKGSSPIQTTHHGTQMIDIARDVLLFHKNLENRVNILKKHPSFAVRIGVFSGYAKGLLTEVISQYIALHPEVDVRLSESGSQTIEHLLMDGKLDIGTIYSFCENPALKYNILLEDDWILAAPKDSDFAQRHQMSICVMASDLKNERFLAKPAGNCSRSLLDSITQFNNIPINILYEFEDFESIASFFPTLNCLSLISVRLFNTLFGKENDTVKAYTIKGVNMHSKQCLCHQKDIFMLPYLSDLINAIYSYYKSR